MQIPSLTEALGMLASGIGVGAVLSFVFTKIAWFAGLESSVKGWIVFAASIALPLAATAALQFVPEALIAALEPYWRAIATGFLIWAGSQVAYRMNNPPAAK